MKTKRNHAFTLIELLVVITIIAILAGLAVPAYNYVQMLANQTRGVNNAKQVIMSMKLFSKEHNTQYPDTVPNPLTGALAQNANDAFRLMIQEKIVTDERIFGCPAGFNPDSNLGQSPGYDLALLPGENHWAMTGGLTDTVAGNMPLVFENPANLNWPPQWNADLAGKVAAGRTWTGGKIIIGRNDGSVAVETLSDTKGMVGPRVMAGGTNLFTQASDGIPQRILPIVDSKPKPLPGPVPPLPEPPSGSPPLAAGQPAAPPASGTLPSPALSSLPPPGL